MPAQYGDVIIGDKVVCERLHPDTGDTRSDTGSDTGSDTRTDTRGYLSDICLILGAHGLGTD